MKHLLSLQKSVKLLIAGSVLVITLPLLNSCAENSGNAAAADSAASMNAADNAATMRAPMADSANAAAADTGNMQTDDSTGGKDVTGSKDKPPKKGDR